MFTSRIKSGAKVYLHRWGDNSGKGVLTRIEVQIPDKKEVLVYAPQVNGRVMNLNTDMYYDLRMFGDTAEYRFKVKFLAHDEIDGFPISRFKLMHDGEKKHRREVFRLNLDAMVMFSIINEDGNQSEKDEGKVVDLSAGGVKIHTNRKIDKGELLNLSIQLENDAVIAFGDIKHAEPAPLSASKLKRKYSYQYGIRFVTLTDSDEEKIIRFLYQKQMQEMRNLR